MNWPGDGRGNKVASVLKAPLREWNADRWALAGIILGAVILWLIFRHLPPSHDVAWLMEGTRRWMAGARLYDDIRELNPPLIFYDMAILSFGTNRLSFFVAGVCAATLASSLWIARHHGPWLGFGVFLSMSFAGLIEFGQREHLLLIFVIPYLLARGSNRERMLLGLWAFLGVGLKPYFLLVVGLPALVEAWRNWRSLFETQKLALGGACAAYVIASYFFYPTYFREIIPQAAAAYSAYGRPSPPLLTVFQTLVIIPFILLADAERRPLAAATVGAIASYYLQGRFWPYHFITAAGLGMILCFWQRRLAYWGVLIAADVFRGPYSQDPDTHIRIPKGISRVVVLSAHVHAAYPTVSGCGVTNETPWGSLGWVPGPWNVVRNPRSSPDDKARAKRMLMTERERLRGLIRARDVQLIISDAEPRKLYFDYPIDYMKLIGPLPEYKLAYRDGRYEYWAKQPLSTELCKERY
jgi:hypothetical protein